MAINKHLDLYLRLERIMIELDDQGDTYADRVRDLMDPLWYALPDKDHEFLDSRGEIDIRALYPVTLTVPDLFQAPSEEKISVAETWRESTIGKCYELKEDIWAA